MNSKFNEKTVILRGSKYRFRELSATEYDELVKLTTVDDETDLSALLKLMVVRSCAEPKMTPEEYGALPYPLVRKLNSIVNQMHFGDDEESGEVVEEVAEESAAS